MPLFAAYGASKAALAVYSKVMRLELSAWGVRVSLIQPTGFRTSTFIGCSCVVDHLKSTRTLA